MFKKTIIVSSWCLFFLHDTTAYDTQKQNWKLTFFEGYMDRYQQLPTGSPKHPDVADILQSSFNNAIALVDEQNDVEQEIVTAVGEQISYFATLQNEQEIQEEMAKCENGMKRANSLLARLMPKTKKADYFVQAFCNEHKKRNS